MSGPRLRRLRRDRRMTLEELAAKAQVTRLYLAQLETGLRTTPTLLVLQRLAKALGVEVGELVE
jgi:XRE family transcriptional regulator, master regulator for biofilm formation